MNASVLRNAFAIYPGEGLKSLRFLRFAVFWALGITTVETLSDGLFLEKAGASYLPLVYLTIALAMIGISTLVLYALRLTSSYRILMIAIGAGVLLSLLASFILMSSPHPWFWFAFKIISRMLFIVLIATSWTFIDKYHDLQDAKRVYSLYSAAYFFGTICSGVLINLLLPMLGFSGLLAIAACSFLLALRETKAIAEKTPTVDDDSVDGNDRSGVASITRLIFRSPFTIFLLSLSLVVQLLMTVTEFNYMDSFGKMLSGESIAAFLGKCRACIAGCNILVGIFCYSRFVRKLGLHNVILFTPIFFLLVYSQWIIHDTLLLAVLGMIAVDGVLFTIEDNGFNLLTNAVPSKLRSQVRIINDSFFEPIGMMISALLLIVLHSQMSRWLGLELTVCTLVIILVLRKLYPKAILINLKDSALHFERTLKDWLGHPGQKDARKEILEALNDPHEDVRLLACESLLLLEDHSSLERILGRGMGFSTLSKIRLLQLFEESAFSNHTAVLETVANWISDNESTELSKWARFYLAKRGLHAKSCVIEEREDLLLRGAAILALPRPLLAAKEINIMLKSSRIDEIGMGLDLLAESTGKKGSPIISKTLPFLSHESILVKRSAARCIARLSNEHAEKFATKLIETLGAVRDNSCRLLCLDALGKIADAKTIKELLIASVHFRPNERRKTEAIIAQMGDKIIPILLTLAKDISIPERGRILVGKVLGRQESLELQTILHELIDLEIDRAYFYFYHGHTLKEPELLKNALLSGCKSVIDFIIHLLGAAGSIEDPELFVRALFSRNAKIQSHAIESLEKTCNPRIFRRIRPLVDDLPLEMRLSLVNLPKLSLLELFHQLGESLSPYDQVVARHLRPAAV
jgi:HEAT repeat protein